MKNAVLIASLFLSTAYAQVTLKGEASKVSWGGHWWTMREGELAFGWSDGDGRNVHDMDEALKFDNCLTAINKDCRELMKGHIADKGITLSPLMKFDLWVKLKVDQTYGVGKALNMYSHATNNELKIHYITGPEHPHYAAAGYAGKCTGWSIANMDYDEPGETKTIDGVTFTPADIKGILAAIYNGAQFFVPDEMVLGNAYRASGPESNDSNYADPAPQDLIQALETHIKKEQKIIVADMDPSDGVWNHPIYAYEVKLKKQVGTKVKGTMVLKYANDEVEIDEVFTLSDERSDLIERELDFELTVPAKWNKKMETVKSGQWTGDSINKHPDSLVLGLEEGWRTSIYQYRNTDMNKEVNYQLIKKVNLGNGYKVMVDELLEKYHAAE